METRAPPRSSLPPPGPPTQRAVASEREGPRGAPRAASSDACGVDALFETVCGSVAPPNIRGTCGPTGDALAAFGKRQVYVTSVSGSSHDPALRAFRLDEEATRAYQTEIPQRLPRENYCCYSRCTALVVAHGAPPLSPPPQHHLAQRCLPPPPGGTSAPAAADPACPAALSLQGSLVPYRHASATPRKTNVPPPASCCYDILVRDEPPNMGHCPTCKCAARGTRIATPTGEVPIESLTRGSTVLSMHHGRLQPVRVVATHREPAANHVVLEVLLASGRRLSMSPRHPTPRGTRGGRFEDLAPGDRLGDEEIVTLARRLYDGAFTYDILPESDTGTYLAEGALVGTTLK